MTTTLTKFLLGCSLATALTAQGQQPAAPPAPAGGAAAKAPAAQAQGEVPYVLRRYPQDKDVPVAMVGGRAIPLGEVIDHIDAVHYPGFAKAMAERPEIQRYLQSDLIAPWVRQYADLVALKAATQERNLDADKLKVAQSTQLKKAFEDFLANYLEQRKKAGRPTELTQQRTNSMLADFQLKNGIAAELQGMLDFLEPDDYTRGQLQEFYQNNARAFGGTVTLAHILIPNRDPGTGILLADAGLAKANAQLADVRARLRPDGSNFDEVAKLCSTDDKTAEKGGLLGDVHRFDDRLPGVLCRAAWAMRDGEVSDVVESQYGWHILKRLDYQQHIFILFTDDAIPSIRMVMRRARQEQLLFDAREKGQVKLLL